MMLPSISATGISMSWRSKSRHQRSPKRSMRRPPNSGATMPTVQRQKLSMGGKIGTTRMSRNHQDDHQASATTPATTAWIARRGFQ